jgi:hypothetical protein
MTPAHAAVPNRWGFAFVDNPSTAGIPVASRQAGSWPAPFQVHSAPQPGAIVAVKFPRIGGKGGVVHVTAVTDQPVWCQAVSFGPAGPDELVNVRCYEVGKPVFVPFTVLYTQSSKGTFPGGTHHYAYLHFEPGSGIVAGFNSSGATDIVTPGATGEWKVVLPGVGSSGLAGNLQVTAVNPKVPATCVVAAWNATTAAQSILVRCYQATTPLSTGWDLSYTRARAITGTAPKRYAYTFDLHPATPSYSPVPPEINFNSVPGPASTIHAAGTGLRLVTFPRVGALPSTVLATAAGSAPGFCSLLSPWAVGGSSAIVRDVACYSGTGARTSRPSLITYTTAP